MSINIRSNSIRADYLHEYMDRTIQEIYDDVATVFGPGAVDAYLIKNNQPYYTRDGLELLESLTFDNPVSEYVRKIIYQSAYNQGKKVGDGSTTLIILYTLIYKELRDYFKNNEAMSDNHRINYPITTASFTSIRKHWIAFMKILSEQLTKQAKPLTKDLLYQMFYTCTQDEELSKHLYDKVGDAILNQAYVIVNKSNIETEMEVTTYEQPMVKATRLFTVRPIQPTEPNTVIYHCNGMLDIAHAQTLFGLMNVQFEMSDPNASWPARNIVFLCNGITDTTRKSTKELIRFLNDHNINPTAGYNNVAIYAIDNYRAMSSAEIEDLSTMITDEVGIGGLVNDIVMESMMYQAFQLPTFIGEEIEELSTFDSDIRFLDTIRNMFIHAYTCEFDDAEGIKMHRELGHNAQARYDKLRDQLEHEKSDVIKVQLNRRLRRMYGHFIEIEVGSKLIKDSQRKFELILDAVVSAAEGVRHGVLTTNSILTAIVECNKLYDEYLEKLKTSEDTQTNLYANIADIVLTALINTVLTMFRGMYPNFDHTYSDYNITDWCKYITESADIRYFDMTDTTDPLQALPVEETTKYKTEELKPIIVEPVPIIQAILENSTIPLELAYARGIHVNDFMQNFL